MSTPESKKVCCEKTCQLLTWKNPVETGKVFGGLLLALIFIKKIQLSHFLTIFYTVVFSFSAIELLSAKVLYKGSKTGLVSKYVAPSECPNVVGFLKPRLDSLLLNLPKWQLRFRSVVFASEPVESIKIAALVYIAAKILKVVSLYNIVVVLVLLSFSLPIVYEKNKVVVDKQVEHLVLLVNKQKNELTDKLEKKLETTPLAKYLPSKKEEVPKKETPTAKVEELNEKINEATTTAFEK